MTIAPPPGPDPLPAVLDMPAQLAAVDGDIADLSEQVHVLTDRVATLTERLAAAEDRIARLADAAVASGSLASQLNVIAEIVLRLQNQAELGSPTRHGGPGSAQ